MAKQLPILRWHKESQKCSVIRDIRIHLSFPFPTFPFFYHRLGTCMYTSTRSLTPPFPNSCPLPLNFQCTKGTTNDTYSTLVSILPFSFLHSHKVLLYSSLPFTLPFRHAEMQLFRTILLAIYLKFADIATTSPVPQRAQIGISRPLPDSPAGIDVVMFISNRISVGTILYEGFKNSVNSWTMNLVSTLLLLAI